MHVFFLASRNEIGYTGQARPRTALTCIEKWQSRSAFEANRASDAMKEFDAQAARLRYGADLYVASELVEP